MFDFSLIYYGMQDTDNLTYSVMLKSWNQSHIILQLNFSEPMMISIGSKPDILSIRVVNSPLFVSQSGATLGDNIIIMDDIPPQIPLVYDSLIN